MLYKISKKMAGVGIILMNIFTIVVFLLVILKILPYNSIGGGRLDSYQAAYQTAMTSIAIIAFGIPLVALVSELIKVKRFKTFFKVWLVFAFGLIIALLYESAIVGVFIVSFGMPLIVIASGLIGFERFRFFSKVYLWLSFVFICLNTIANLLGVTLFEKVIMSLVTIIQAILFFRLATDKESIENAKLNI